MHSAQRPHLTSLLFLFWEPGEVPTEEKVTVMLGFEPTQADSLAASGGVELSIITLLCTAKPDSERANC